MYDKISFTMKLMLLVTINMARLQPPGGMRNDSWKVPVGFLTWPSPILSGHLTRQIVHAPRIWPFWASVPNLTFPPGTFFQLRLVTPPLLSYTMWGSNPGPSKMHLPRRHLGDKWQPRYCTGLEKRVTSWKHTGPGLTTQVANGFPVFPRGAMRM